MPKPYEEKPINVHRVKFTMVSHQGHIVHRVDNHTVVLRRVLRDTTETRLDHVVSVEKLLLGVRLQPDLVLIDEQRMRAREERWRCYLGVGSDEVECRDVQTKLARLGKSTEARAEAEQFFARKIAGVFDDRFAKRTDRREVSDKEESSPAVIDPLAVQTKRVEAIRALE